MSDDYKSPFFESENDLNSADDIDLFSSSDNQLDLNSFADSSRNTKEQAKDEKGFFSNLPFNKNRKKARHKKKRNRLQWFLTALLIFAITFSILIASFAIYVFGFVDDVVQENLNDLKLDFTTTIYVKNSKTGEFVEYQRLHGSENRIWVSFEKMPQYLRDAFVSIEDQRFYDHNGVDWKRTLSAFANMFVDIYSSNQGGSTITQQLVKNLTGDKKQNAMRKIREIMRARYLENNYSKDTILECYLNTASFANGICGVEVASNYYFNKSTDELTIAECATLAGIVKNPEKYRPDKNPEDNKARRKLVLDKMLELNKIDKEQYDQAISEEVTIVADSSILKEKDVNNYFVDALIDNVVEGLVEKYNYDETYAAKNFYNGGYKIYCTMDSDIQAEIEKVYTTSSYFSKNSKGETAQSSITIMDYSGHVVGICGGSGEKTTNRGLNRATSSPRPAGSTIKPMSAYAPALENNLITYSTYLKDQPIGKINGKQWPPNSYGYYGGNMPIYKALERSANTIPAQLVQQLSLQTSFDFLTKNLGLNTLETGDNKDLNYSSLALGGCYKGITTLQEAAAFATFGNLGYYYKPTFYTRVTDQHGAIVLEYDNQASVAMSEDTAYIMNKLLEKPVYGSQGTGRSAASYVTNMPLFGKTGTTDTNNDKWFVGGTPYYVASVWYGYDNPYKVSNGGAAIKIWGTIMGRIHKNLPKKAYPESTYVTTRRFCATTGLLATNSCPIGGTGYYKTSYLPVCTSHGGSILGEVSVVTSSNTSSNISSAASSVPASSSQTSSNTTTTSSTTSSNNTPNSTNSSNTPSVSQNSSQ